MSISGANLASTPSLSCRFATSMVVDASVHGSDSVLCVSPSGLPTGWTSIELSSFGSVLYSGGSFYVHGSLALSAAVPSMGPVSGGTRVSVLAQACRTSGRCIASLGLAAARAWLLGALALGRLSAPPPPSSRRALAASRCHERQQYTSSGDVTFTYLPEAAVSSTPSSGASEGGTPVTVLERLFSCGRVGRSAAVPVQLDCCESCVRERQHGGLQLDSVESWLRGSGGEHERARLHV